MTDVSGRLELTPQGRDLVLIRSLALPIEEAWAYLSEPHLTEEWFGPWDGDARAGGGVRVRMRFEDSAPAVKMRILACDAPHRLALHAVDEYVTWKLDLLLEADGDEDTLLYFTHHLDEDTDLGAIGPGWEFYLDMLVAATEDTERPAFDMYYPALREPYLALRP